MSWLDDSAGVTLVAAGSWSGKEENEAASPRSWHLELAVSYAVLSLHPMWLLSPWHFLLQGLSSGPWLQQDGLDFLTAWPVGSSWKLSWLFMVRLGAGMCLVPIEFCWSKKVRGPFRFKVWGRSHQWASSQSLATPSTSLPCRISILMPPVR